MRFLLKSAAIAFAAFASLALAPQKRAEAYPQWQFTSGTIRCNQCHFSPGGGGLIKGYGRDAIGEELSTWEGNGAFAHGAVELPSWLALGADFRGAFLQHDPGGPDAPTTALFPMQADAQVRVSFGDFSLNGIVGMRGQVRRESADVPPTNIQPENASRFLSREHFVLWQPGSQGVYARAGRFFAPFGLRFAEHLLTTRRDAGFNTLQESYNLSGGYISNEWEGHLTLYLPDVVQNIGSQESGLAGYFETRLLDETLAVGGQFRAGTIKDGKQAMVGAIAKYYVEPANMIVMAEFNGGTRMPDGSDSSLQMNGIFGAGFLPFKGIMVTGLVERKMTDVNVKDTATDALTGLVSWFPYPHFELQVAGRMVKPSGQDVVPTLLVQLHYFL